VGVDEVVEALRLRELGLQIDVVLVAEPLVELHRVGLVGAFDLAARPLCPRIDVDVLEPEVLDVRVNLGMKLVPGVGPDLPHTEREPLERIVEEALAVR
jgi:hypothetical protein